LEEKKLNFRFCFLIVLAFVSICFASYSQNVFAQPSLEGKISGTVTEAVSGQPISGATVNVGIGSFVNQSTTTNVTGQYFIGGLVGNLTGVTYNVTVAKIGYSMSSANVSLKTEIDFLPPATQNFTLTPIQTATPSPTPTIPEFSLWGFMAALVAVNVLLAGVEIKKKKLKDVND
jgi:hypothetical protein